MPSMHQSPQQSHICFLLFFSEVFTPTIPSWAMLSAKTSSSHSISPSWPLTMGLLSLPIMTSSSFLTVKIGRVPSPTFSLAGVNQEANTVWSKVLQIPTELWDGMHTRIPHQPSRHCGSETGSLYNGFPGDWSHIQGSSRCLCESHNRNKLSPIRLRLGFTV